MHVKQKQARASLQACMGDLTTRGFKKLINHRVAAEKNHPLSKSTFSKKKKPKFRNSFVGIGILGNVFNFKFNCRQDVSNEAELRSNSLCSHEDQEVQSIAVPQTQALA